MLIPSHGIVGAASATVLGYWTAAGLMLAVMRRLLAIGTLRYALLGLPVAAVAACALVLEGIPFYVGGVAAVTVSAYLLIAGFGRLFGREVLTALAGLDLPILVKSGLVKVFSAKAS